MIFVIHKIKDIIIHKLKILNRYRPISILFSRLLNFQKINYAAGTGFFLSKDLIEKIINFNSCLSNSRYLIENFKVLKDFPDR